ncbi:MAG: mitomycin resistance protein [Gammaproteobacteria bacterium]|nr:MAG: mitomycin resistance protein [Gammaproteobacteria bacterium]
MNPNKVKRRSTKALTDLPNIGKIIEQDLLLLGISQPSQLIGKNPYYLYEELCRKTGKKQDLCVLDVFISITSFMNGNDPKPWWTFTEERKKHITNLEQAK